METLDESTSSKRSGSPRSEFSKRHKKRVKIVDEVRNVFTFFMAVRCLNIKKRVSGIFFL